MYQQTLRSPCLIHGIGLHSGKEASISLLPAPVDTGIVFRVNKGKQQVEIPAKPEFVTRTNLNTGLGSKGVEIATVEHLLAAMAGLEIDNVVVLTHGTEIPAMDGSAQPFVSRIMEVGRQMQLAPRHYLKVLAPIVVEEGEKSAGLYPSQEQVYSCAVDFPHPVVGRQALRLNISPQIFISELAKARTFGFEEEINMLHSQGLALGAGLENAVGLGKNGTVLNGDGLRYPDEFVRHKILDALGDMSLIGHPILAEYRGVKSGHTMNLKLLQALAELPAHWEIVTDSDLPKAKAV